jgi:hypothetical protein
MGGPELRTTGDPDSSSYNMIGNTCGLGLNHPFAAFPFAAQEEWREFIMSRSTRLACLVFTLASVGYGGANAEVFVAPERMDHPTTVQSEVSFDPSTHTYRYSYTITNDSDNPRGVDHFSVKLDPGARVLDGIESPAHWRGTFVDRDSTVSWWATDTAAFIPSDYVDDGHSIPPFGPFVQPGESLSGFSFRSFSPPVQGVGYTQTFRPLPWAEDADDLEGLPFLSDDPEENGFEVAIQVPSVDNDFFGNRRPAVDGFLVFANVKNKDSYRGSALIVVRFAAGGEQVDTGTFRATLNRQDVTAQFAFSPLYGGWAATFYPDASPLEEGTNVLLTSVSGVVPGADRPALDTDRLTFIFSRD